MPADEKTVREKLIQARRLLRATADPVTVDRLRAYIRQLEAELLSQMGKTSE